MGQVHQNGTHETLILRSPFTSDAVGHHHIDKVLELEYFSLKRQKALLVLLLLLLLLSLLLLFYYYYRY